MVKNICCKVYIKIVLSYEYEEEIKNKQTGELVSKYITNYCLIYFNISYFKH